MWFVVIMQLEVLKAQKHLLLGCYDSIQCYDSTWVTLHYLSHIFFPKGLSVLTAAASHVIYNKLSTILYRIVSKYCPVS